MYAGINVTNNVISKVPGIAGMTDEERNKALGELYFIRALNHFNLLNYFGAVPVITTPTVGVGNLDKPRNVVQDVYNQIISDLLFATDHLSVSGNKTRTSKYAAKSAIGTRLFVQRRLY